MRLIGHCQWSCRYRSSSTCTRLRVLIQTVRTRTTKSLQKASRGNATKASGRPGGSPRVEETNHRSHLTRQLILTIRRMVPLQLTPLLQQSHASPRSGLCSGITVDQMKSGYSSWKSIQPLHRRTLALVSNKFPVGPGVLKFSQISEPVALAHDKRLRADYLRSLPHSGQHSCFVFRKLGGRH